LWGLAILLDIAATIVGGQSEGWNLHPEHFVERHGLFVIIILGETLIVAASQITNTTRNADLVGVALLAVGISCGFWWTYFTRARPKFENSMEVTHGIARTLLARDAFSLAHFPMVIGVIAYAGAINEALAHPAEPLHSEWLFALALGLVLFVGGTGIALWRATGQLPLPRVILSLVSALIIMLLPDVAPFVSLAIAFSGVAVIAALEQRAV
jgi:low temperature requirement protein LtrA